MRDAFGIGGEISEILSFYEKFIFEGPRPKKFSCTTGERGEKRWSFPESNGIKVAGQSARKLTNRTMAAARVLCAMALVAIAVVVDVGESVDDALE